MAWNRRVLGGCALGLGLWVGIGAAQTLPTTSEDALHTMEESAGVIFTGQVTAVRRVGAKGGAAGMVEIDFAVQDAIRGVSGGVYTLREWAGLWPGDDEPFRVGQQYLMLLHSPGASGLSSPVGGMDGAIPIRGEGAAVAPDAGGMTEAETNQNARRGVSAKDAGAGEGGAQVIAAGSSSAADRRVADLGWVGTRVVRSVAYQPAPSRRGLARPMNAVGASANGASAEEATALVGTAGTTQVLVSSKAGYATVVGMLRGWDREDHGTR